ncbi:MAG TPA: MarR family transcriptional regulator [Gemmatimonadaceae bacterium]|nr:MarR family transcriptional regulator [Gemmatimonadaceae bacterium]
MNEVDVEARPSSTAKEPTIFSLLHAAHALEDRVEAALGSVELSSPKYSVLTELVGSDKPVSLGELASRLSCVRSNMTQLVDRLEADGLVKRVDCPTDRRSVNAAITELGRTRQQAGAEALATLHTEFAAQVDAKDRAAMERLLRVLG